MDLLTPVSCGPQNRLADTCALGGGLEKEQADTFRLAQR